ncbi:MAG: hypothetical protein HYW01_06450 [Deltaproteobacteria bacterium]|nr:hypothetical protein [Deltaproteobacteria bacterium]
MFDLPKVFSPTVTETHFTIFCFPFCAEVFLMVGKRFLLLAIVVVSNLELREIDFPFFS